MLCFDGLLDVVLLLVLVCFPHDALGWSVVCDGGISWL